jgi:hypothetical protein
VVKGFGLILAILAISAILAILHDLRLNFPFFSVAPCLHGWGWFSDHTLSLRGPSCPLWLKVLV